MATDVDVQYFSHLNGLTLSNNWGDLIRLLDKVLVTGIDFTQITAASIDAQGNVYITLYSAHNAMLFQIVELSGFTPASFNQKYRIKGIPSTTELILRPHTAITETAIAVIGAGKLASLGYEIIFQDVDDVKRVYRAKNPRVEHPYIRVDETISDGVNSYSSAYAKYAMVGLLEHMDHIDDYNKSDVLQTPFDPADPTKNWRITGTGQNVVRGWSCWYWNVGTLYNDNASNSLIAPNVNAPWSICGDQDAFYFAPSAHNQVQKQLWGCGIYNDPQQLNAPWFLFAALSTQKANENFQFGYTLGGSVLMLGQGGHQFITTSTDINTLNHKTATPILPDYSSGMTTIYEGSEIPALEIPFFDSDKKLRGSLKHVFYMGKKINSTHATPEISTNNELFLKENLRQSANNQTSSAGVYFYLGVM
ncbi:hypothetical protein ACVBEE_02720 [Acinetobacter sp. ANC 3781]